jgi:hypothetical protein
MGLSGISPLFGDPALSFVYTIPRPGSALNPAETSVAIRYNASLDDNSLSDTLFIVTGESSGHHIGEVVLATDGNTLL